MAFQAHGSGGSFCRGPVIAAHVGMITTLEKPIRRLVQIDGEPYVVTLSAEGLRIVRKGHRKGQEITWGDVISGTAKLDADLVKSLRKAPPRGGGSADSAARPRRDSVVGVPKR